MRTLTHICQIILILAMTAEAHAKSAAEIFESVSNSIVVVYADDGKGKRQSQGSGVVLPGGDVATNCHVIKKSDSFVVKHQEKEYPAKLKHADFDRDVCSLSVKDLRAPQAPLGVTRTLKVGQKVYAIGAPQGLELTMSEGIVSSLREMGGGQYIQTTAPISPGSSGGGLFDDVGRLIGLPTFFFAKGQQLNFAVPVEWVKELPKREAASQKTGMTIVEWLNKAIEFENKENWPAMIHHAQNWTRSSPQEPQAWYILGVANGHADQPTEAIEAYQKALRINSEYAVAWSNLGANYRLTKQFEKAIEAYQQALRINPQDAGDWSNLGSIYADIGQIPKAIEIHRHALAIDPDIARVWFNLGVAYGMNEESGKAIESYQQALRINPGYKDAWNNLGIRYLLLNQPSKAIEPFQAALRLDSNKANAWWGLGQAYSRSGQRAKAIEAYQQYLRIDPKDIAVWLDLGIAYKIEGQTNKVMEVHHQLQTLDPDTAEAFFGAAILPQ